MALTKITAKSVEDDAITTEQIAHSTITDTNLADDSCIQAKIADEAVDEARLQISNAGSNGQFLQKQSSNTGGLTWATVSTGTALTGSTDNTVCTVTAANAIQGEANFKYDGTDIDLESASDFNIHMLKTSVADGWVRNVGNLDLASASGGATGQKITLSNGANEAGLTAKLTVESGGDITVNTGNLVIGTAGKGIDFSAVSHAGGMTSELFDSYEEGTYTPTLSAVVNSYAKQYGFYTKIGNVVHFSIWIEVSSIGSNNTNTLQVSLPFTSKNITNYRGSGTFTGASVTFDTAYTGVNRSHIGHNTSMMDMSFGFKSDFDAGWHTGVIKNNNTDNETKFQISGTYLAD